jgi:uncharacterized membrane protein YeaQ/YmgE (transglycosylase-associated protein family)
VEVLALVITGGLAGWIAGILMRGAGYGLVINVVLGIVGGLIGGKLFALAGVRPDGWLIEVAMAVVGAVLLLSLVTLLRRRPAE